MADQTPRRAAHFRGEEETPVRRAPREGSARRAPARDEGVRRAPAREEGVRRAPARETPRAAAGRGSGNAPAAARKKSRKKARQRAARQLRNALILIFSLLIALTGGALYAGSCISAGETNLPGVSVNGIDVSGLTRQETEALLLSRGVEAAAETPLTVLLPAGESFEVDPAEAGAVHSARGLAEMAYRYGHSGKWLADLRCWLQGRLGTVSLTSTLELNDDYISRTVHGAEEAFAAKMAAEAGYRVDVENAALILRKGAGALTLSEGRLTELVRQALLDGETGLSFGELTGQPTEPDFGAIYQELNVEPQDAYFVEGGWDVVDEIVGCTFDTQQADTLWNGAGWLEEVRVPLTITYPEVTGESLRSLLFRDLLGEQTTYFPNSIQNRISNIELAASRINGIVLNPGEVFSYNETIGERTLEAGYLLAGAYSNGEEVEEIGGGICQVSSTLYCAVLYSQLGIRSRDSHYFKVVYLDYGLDATVSWPRPDFKFENTRDYPIRINAYADPVERFVTVEIWGTDTDGTHIELTNERYRVEDETWGVQIGWNVYLYARVYDAEGNLLEIRELPVSTYHFHDEDIDWPPEKFAEAEVVPEY